MASLPTMVAYSTLRVMTFKMIQAVHLIITQVQEQQVA